MQCKFHVYFNYFEQKMLKVNTCKRNICSDRESQSLYIFYQKSITEVFMRLFSQHWHYSSQGCSLDAPAPSHCQMSVDVTPPPMSPWWLRDGDWLRQEWRKDPGHTAWTRKTSPSWVNTSRHQNVHHGFLRDTQDVIMTFLSVVASILFTLNGCLTKHGCILVVWWWPPVTARVCPC